MWSDGDPPTLPGSPRLRRGVLPLPFFQPAPEQRLEPHQRRNGFHFEVFGAQAFKNKFRFPAGVDLIDFQKPTISPPAVGRAEGQTDVVR